MTSQRIGGRLDALEASLAGGLLTPSRVAAEEAQYGRARWRMADGARCYGSGDSVTVLSGGCALTYKIEGVDDLWGDA